ncbi:hypothetical protein LSAT2_010448 [Lamellibrachia satsuma]|nr:hypothetical protein LSAT2_010448 [Lamellibrachia satsuma]
MTTRQHIMWTTLVLCVLYRRLTAQPTMDQCSTDDDNSRQLLRMEQMMSMLQSIGERQVSLLEQMHCTLLSTNRHVKENQVDVRCRQDVDGSRTCYKFVRENMMWDQARSYCRAFTDGADLVSIESRIEQDFLSLNLRVKPSPGGATCHPLLSPPRHCFAVILSPGALRVKRVDGSDGSRAVT